ncbi:hypothetical protein FOIG_02352 [Fusarium odoratissimum NRRL 54006]|uniref:Uncharacterized protein n=2 Tax=Fusarium oxysporum species complex TaxID=171631 RepID=X0KLP5_FUSO5|nr:uncharacterized protein FOIG_02352 [Fusarium odoratissimum NRRL 54006]EXM09591.1 hypothetical protein FOIG_02352 [Fusarium odoratissimum NRRL 54006]TXC05543.1 hypothetical protein FocTR4_00010233 [Fusarium oxysporum f. sp. cubense]
MSCYLDLLKAGIGEERIPVISNRQPKSRILKHWKDEMTNTIMNEDSQILKLSQERGRRRGKRRAELYGIYKLCPGDRPLCPRSRASLVMCKDIVRTREYSACDEPRTWKKMGSCNCAIAAMRINDYELQLRLITTSTLYLSRWGRHAQDKA